MPYSARCYHETASGDGCRQWQEVSGFPWLSGTDEEGAAKEAIERLFPVELWPDIEERKLL